MDAQKAGGPMLKNETRPEPGRPRTWRTGTLVYTTGGLALLFLWLLFGDFAWQLKERSVTATAQLTLKQLGASDFFVGLLVGSLPTAVGMILGPLVSVKSDRHRGRWGRRIPYLLIPLPAIVLSMAGLAFSPWLGGMIHRSLGDSSPGLGVCGLVAFAVFWTFFEIASVIANAVFGGLVNDVVPQQVIGRFFGYFRMVSLIDGIIFNYFLIEYAETHPAAVFLGIGLFYGAGFLLMCLKVKEGRYPPPEPVPAAEGLRFAGLKSYLRDCFRTPYYLWIFSATTLCLLAFGPVNTYSIFYAKSLGMSMDVYGRYIAASFACSLILAYFLGALADRFHPLRLGMVVMALYAAASCWGFFAASDPAQFGVVFMAHNVLSGAYFTSMASVGQRLYPRLKFAQFASASSLLYAACATLLPPAVGFILDATGHLYRLTFLFGGTLGLCGFAALVVVYRNFLRLGGPKNYLAPGSTPAESA